MASTLVTIFPGPVPYFRVRELAPDACQAQTVKWCGSYGDAVEFIRENYSTEQALPPNEIRNEVLRRRTHPEARNG